MKLRPGAAGSMRTYKIMPTWSITAGVGIDDPEEDDFKVSGTRNSMGDTAFSENLQAYLNTWYSITPAHQGGSRVDVRGYRARTGRRRSESRK